MGNYAWMSCAVCGAHDRISVDGRPERPFICSDCVNPNSLRNVIVSRGMSRRREPQVFIRCDVHPSMGGPHISRGLYVGRYFDLKASLVMCTHRSKRGSVCGAQMLALD